MKDTRTTNCGKIPSKYIKEPFYSFGFKDGVKAERQRIKEEIKIEFAKMRKHHFDIGFESSLSPIHQSDFLCFRNRILLLLEGEK